MHIIAFVVYGLLAGCLTAAAGFFAVRLCIWVERSFGAESGPAPGVAAMADFLRR